MINKGTKQNLNSQRPPLDSQEDHKHKEGISAKGHKDIVDFPIHALRAEIIKRLNIITLQIMKRTIPLSLLNVFTDDLCP